MLNPYVTWGELRKLHTEMAKGNVVSPDDLLADEKMQKYSEDFPDDTYVYGPETRVLNSQVTHWLAVDEDSGAPLEVLQEDTSAGTLSHRIGGEWVSVSADNERVTESNLLALAKETSDDAIRLWDDRSGKVTRPQINLFLENFQ